MARGYGQAPGKLYRVDGADLHLVRRGTGSPAVVVATGGGVVALRWDTLLNQFAEFTTAIAYDRPGYGWSSAGTRPRTLENVSRELAALLDAGDVPPPYVLVGHSIGGPYIREFARDYPERVAGLVFVDSSHEDQARRMPIPPSLLKRQKRLAALSRKPWFPVVARPLLALQARRMVKADGQLRKTLIRQQSARSLITAARAEADSIESFSDSLARPVPPVPLVALVAGNFPKMPGVDPQLHSHLQKTWLELQRELAALSPLGELRVVEGAGHMIPDDKPEAVLQAVRDVVEQAHARMPEAVA